jgi:hypothetical protein
MQGDVTDREVSLYIKPGSRGNVAIGKFHALWSGVQGPRTTGIPLYSWKSIFLFVAQQKMSKSDVIDVIDVNK